MRSHDQAGSGDQRVRAGHDAEGHQQTEGADPALPAARRQRDVVALRVFPDLDTEATAKTLGIAPGTVATLRGRARPTRRQQPNGTVTVKEQTLDTAERPGPGGHPRRHPDQRVGTSASMICAARMGGSP
jgi:hypothetical protein